MSIFPKFDNDTFQKLLDSYGYIGCDIKVTIDETEKGNMKEN